MKLIIGQVQSGHAVIYVGHIDGEVVNRCRGRPLHILIASGMDGWQ